LSLEGQAELVVLMGRVAAGDREGFRLLYQRSSAKLYASVRRILRSEAAAEDAVQEAFVRIWRRAGDFDATIASPIAWMTTIARHSAIDSLRRSAERISASSAGDQEILDGLADDSAPAAGALAGGGLARCLEGVEPDKRNMVLLAYCYGWSREELASRFNRPVATVKTLLRRTLIALKECLGGRD
jgi:RNA polymerase sigma-70 factor, ECF subfamily